MEENKFPDFDKPNPETAVAEKYSFAPALKIYLWLTVLLTLICAAGQTCVLFFGYDTAKNVFNSGNDLGKIVGWGIFAAVLILLSSAFVIKKSADSSIDGLPDGGSLSAFFSAMSGGLVIAATVFSFIDIKFSSAASAQKIIAWLLLVFSIPAGIYLIMSALTKKQNSLSLQILGFFPVLWIASNLMRVYFDRTSAINDPLKILLQISLVAIMLYFLMELRVRIGKPRLGLYFASAMIAITLGFTTSASFIVAKLLRLSGFSCDLLITATELLISLYIFSRLFSFYKKRDK